MVVEFVRIVVELVIHDAVFEVGTGLSGEELAPADGARVVVFEPGGDAR